MANPKGLGPGTVVLVSGDSTLVSSVSRWLGSRSLDVKAARTGSECLSVLEREVPDLVFIDDQLPDGSGTDLVLEVKARHPLAPVVILTSGLIEAAAVDRMPESGIYDHLIKPVDEGRVLVMARNALALRRLSVRARSLEMEIRGEGYARIVGRSRAMKDLFRRLDRVAASDITILIHGESGTGKELIASAVHENSSRRDQPFVAINCAAIPETLQESELFGHERGAFTGAVARRKGRFEEAHRGTIFLDELSELTPGLQAKLLRVVQEKSFQRVGGSQTVEVDVRIVSATNRDLRAATESGRFREDLFYRLAVMEIEVPPLRDREGDVVLLAHRFLEDYDAGAGRAENRSFSLEALEALIGYAWPGNVRELQNVIQCAAVLVEGDLIELADLGPRVRDAVAGGAQDSRDPRPVDSLEESIEHPPQPVVEIPPGMTLSDLEREAVRQAFRRAGGNVSATARDLGISRSRLYRKLEGLETTGGASRSSSGD